VEIAEKVRWCTEANPAMSRFCGFEGFVNGKSGTGFVLLELLWMTPAKRCSISLSTSGERTEPDLSYKDVQ
jgi:hypothetical protein